MKRASTTSDSESKRQSMQWNKQITLCNSFSLCQMQKPMTAKMHKIFIARKSYCACPVLSLATIRSKYYFNFILNRTRSGQELFDCPSSSVVHSMDVIEKELCVCWLGDWWLCWWNAEQVMSTPVLLEVASRSTDSRRTTTKPSNS